MHVKQVWVTWVRIFVNHAMTAITNLMKMIMLSRVFCALTTNIVMSGLLLSLAAIVKEGILKTLHIFEITTITHPGCVSHVRLKLIGLLPSGDELDVRSVQITSILRLRVMSCKTARFALPERGT